jgi:hypothetical protein
MQPPFFRSSFFNIPSEAKDPYRHHAPSFQQTVPGILALSLCFSDSCPFARNSRPTGFPITAIPRDDGNSGDFGNPPHPFFSASSFPPCFKGFGFS